MPRKVRVAKPRLTVEYGPHVVTHLETGEFPDDAVFEILAMQRELPQAWAALREDILGRWRRERPGRRPWGWWMFDAPRWRRDDQPSRVQRITALDVAEPRKRLGGIGTPSYEVLNVWPTFDRGLPLEWVTDFDVAYYNGRARDIHGVRIGTEFCEGQFSGLAIDPLNPPRYESEAAYLSCHGLLDAAERVRVPANAWTPVVIPIEIPADLPGGRVH